MQERTIAASNYLGMMIISQEYHILLFIISWGFIIIEGIFSNKSWWWVDECFLNEDIVLSKAGISF